VGLAGRRMSPHSRTSNTERQHEACGMPPIWVRVCAQPGTPGHVHVTFKSRAKPTPTNREESAMSISNYKSKAKATSRRKFLLAAGAAGAATVAMPQVSRAQTTTLKMQTSWPATDIFTEMAQQYVERVNSMAGGRLKLD